ncbi:MAG: hypothetical protein J6128_04910, partial [Clostridia bacterium]|nr:hypothetical protein [Clostridia bacterium]
MKRALSLLIVFQLLVLIFLPSCAGSASSQPAQTSDSPETTLDTDVSGSPESEVTSTDHGEDESDLLMPEKL